MPGNVRALVATLLMLAGAGLSQPAGADAADAWYDGRTITYLVATAPGGGFDQYARLIAPYLEKNLPGSLVVVRNVPGAGQLVGAAELYHARPDGLTIGTFSTGLAYAQVAGAEGVDFDLAKLSWIGKAASDARVLLVRNDHPAAAFADLSASARPLRFVTPSVGSSGHIEAVMLTQAFAIPATIVSGFSGSEGDAAIMKGEADAIFGSESSLRPLVDNGFARPLLVVGAGAESGAAVVARADAIAQTPAQADTTALIDAASDVYRVTAGPPGVPADRLADLRAAYDRALADPELLAAAARQRLAIAPMAGPGVAQRMAALMTLLAANARLFAPTLR